MRYYKFGNPAGRFIGSSGGIDVYPASIVRNSVEGQKSQIAAAQPGEFYFGYGPSTGGMIESVGIDFLTPGEFITDVSVNPKYKMRRINVREKSIGDAILAIERINAFHCASHSIAFASAVEDALGVDVPEGVMYARIVALELERIRSNLLVIERMCQPAGFGVPGNQLALLREEISRLISAATGHRYFLGSISAGGISINLARISKVTQNIASQFRNLYDSLLESKIFMSRLINNGKISTESLLGPAARASGHANDARLDSQTLDYSGLGFSPILRTGSDSFARMQVRSEEIIQSADIIEKALELASSSIASLGNHVDGEGAGRVESPQGDVFYYVRLENSMLADVVMVSPSLSNIDAFVRSMKGNIFTDFHFNWESFGIWISEAGVEVE